MGFHARRFAQFLNEGGQSLWQVLPLNPTSSLGDNSPYSSSSAFAGSPLLVSPEMMVHERFLEREDALPVPAFPRGRVDFPAVADYKMGTPPQSFRPVRGGQGDEEFQRYLLENDYWLPDHATVRGSERVL